MTAKMTFLLMVSVFVLCPHAADALDACELENVAITDTQGQAITEAQPSQDVLYEATIRLTRPGIVILHGKAVGNNWTQTLRYRVRAGLPGAYRLTWPGKIPFSASGEARIEITQYIPLFAERIQRSAYFTVTPFEAEYVGSESCSGCHAALFTAWEQTKHYPYTGCEACHGPGGSHISSPSSATIIVDTSANVCKPCHSRNDGRVIEAGNGFIKPQQQYNEWAGTKHGRFLQCAGCHNPHYSLQGAPIQAIKLTCRTCHLFKKRYLGMQFVACTSCHMAPAVKSVDSTGIGPYRKGDAASHIWRIKTEAEPYHMFALDGSFAVQDGGGPFLTLNFACLSCHNGLQARFYDFISVQKTSTLVH
jgi:hypothetical protein